jgi:hypothetical protein
MRRGVSSQQILMGWGQIKAPATLLLWARAKACGSKQCMSMLHMHVRQQQQEQHMQRCARKKATQTFAEWLLFGWKIHSDHLALPTRPPSTTAAAVTQHCSLTLKVAAHLCQR